MINPIYYIHYPLKTTNCSTSNVITHAYLRTTNNTDSFIRQPKSLIINNLKDKLDKILTSDSCPKPNIESFIPNKVSEDEQIKILKDLFQQSKFFSRIESIESKYGKNFEFAKLALESSDNATKLIKEGKDFETILNGIAQSYSKETNINSKDLSRQGKSGIYRGDSEPPEWIIEGLLREDECSTHYGYFRSSNGNKRIAYKEYCSRFKDAETKVKSPYEGFVNTRISDAQHKLFHPYHDEVNTNMGFVSNAYNKFGQLVSDYQKNGYLNGSQIKKADDIISEVYYLFAHTCPFNRGSNGIADILMRSSYSAIGIDKPHIKKGVSLDLEAFSMNLDEYKAKWNTFFE